MGKTPIVPVVYIQPPQKCGAKDLFQEIIEYLKFKATKGTVSDFRGRTKVFILPQSDCLSILLLLAS
jgi:DNA transposition AAA+ family ATPase